MSILGLVILWLATLVIALVGGWSLMYHVSYVVLLLGVIAWGWTYVGAKTITVERRSRSQRAQVGGYFEEWVAVDNIWYLPLPWVEIHSDSTLSEHAVRHGFVLAPKARRSWTLRTECTTRGKFTVGDIVVTSGDPFGLFQRQVRCGSETTLIVYPRTVAFSTPGYVPGQLPGGSQQRGNIPFVTPTAAGVRDYQPADPFNRIHWPSTARTGRLMVKDFELDPFADVWIMLDLYRYAHVGHGSESTEEYSVTVAASLARHFLMQNRAVGMLTQREILHPDRGMRQLTRVLELLAVVRADRWEKLGGTLAAESMRLNRLATVFVVTPSVEGEWVTVCQDLKHRGASILAVLVEASTFGSSTSSIDVVGSLASANVPTYLVKRGDPLEEILARPNLAGLMGTPGFALAGDRR
ncbi:MAG: DUF58 domain-containing protein [Chloroflexi bacterium]|nr:DUF58 domain-containing protein [Chloroflexota bacterium]